MPKNSTLNTSKLKKILKKSLILFKNFFKICD